MYEHRLTTMTLAYSRETRYFDATGQLRKEDDVVASVDRSVDVGPVWEDGEA